MLTAYPCLRGKQPYLCFDAYEAWGVILDKPSWDQAPAIISFKRISRRPSFQLGITHLFKDSSHNNPYLQTLEHHSERLVFDWNAHPEVQAVIRLSTLYWHFRDNPKASQLTEFLTPLHHHWD